MLFTSFLDLVLPPRCTFCDSISKEPICSTCSETIKLIFPPFCNICGVPFKSAAVESHVCGECIKNKRHFTWARGVLLYNDATSKAIHKFKYGKDTTYSKALGEIISGYRDIKDFDVVIPVPLHIKRLKERGFNQSLLLARSVGKKFNITIDPFSLKRIRWTEPQVNLKGMERKINVKGAFEVSSDLRGRRVLLIDDVYTTGATVAECSKVLKKSGAEDVCVLTLARTADI